VSALTPHDRCRGWLLYSPLSRRDQAEWLLIFRFTWCIRVAIGFAKISCADQPRSAAWPRQSLCGLHLASSARYISPRVSADVPQDVDDRLPVLLLMRTSPRTG
jgi:hypothetical protein